MPTDERPAGSTEEHLRRLFESAVKSAERAAEGDNIGDFEPEAVAFLDAVLEAPSERSFVTDLLIQGVLAMNNTELFEYVFHYLRWPELRSFVEGLRETWREDLRAMQVLPYLLESFEDTYEVVPWFKGYPNGLKADVR